MSEFGKFRKTSKSDGGQNCVEVADAVDGTAVRVRDSKDQSGPVLEFGATGWTSFIRHATGGAFRLNG